MARATPTRLPFPFFTNSLPSTQMKRRREADFELSAETQAELAKVGDLFDAFIKDYSTLDFCFELIDPESSSDPIDPENKADADSHNEAYGDSCSEADDEDSIEEFVKKSKEMDAIAKKTEINTKPIEIKESWTYDEFFAK
jgi:hypothetical protein